MGTLKLSAVLLMTWGRSYLNKSEWVIIFASFLIDSTGRWKKEPSMIPKIFIILVNLSRWLGSNYLIILSIASYSSGTNRLSRNNSNGLDAFSNYAWSYVKYSPTPAGTASKFLTRLMVKFMRVQFSNKKITVCGRNRDAVSKYIDSDDDVVVEK